MCQSVVFADPTCKCRWMQISVRCEPNFGFSTCPSFFNGITKPSPEIITTARSNMCPVHDFGGRYDRNDIRLILDVQKGLRWGLGPDVGDYGVECKCCAVM